MEALKGITAAFGSAPRGRGQAAVDDFLDSEFPSFKDGVDGGASSRDTRGLLLRGG